MIEFTVSGLTSVINQLLPEPHAGLLNGILFGTKTTLSPDLYQALIRSGTLHIVALSGMNITILAGLIDLTLTRFISRRLASLLTIGLIAWFVWFVGPSPSIIRAAIMGSISLLAVVFGRQTWALLSWVLAVSIMILLNTAWLGDLSFQLSALATLGIILFGGDRKGAVTQRTILSTVMRNSSQRVLPGAFPQEYPQGDPFLGVPLPPSPATSQACLTDAQQIRALVKSATSWAWKTVEDALRITLAAQVFTIPLIWWAFHRVSLVSPLANLLIGWLIAPLTVLGLATAGSGYISLPLGQAIGWIVWVPLQYLITVVKLTSRIPGASLGQ